MIVWSSQLKKKYCAAFLKQMSNFNLLLTVTSDINGVLFALFNPVFVPENANTSAFRAKQTKFTSVGFSQQPNLKM
jgi:hypothetical protein